MSTIQRIKFVTKEFVKFSMGSLLVLGVSTAFAANVVLVNADSANEGFNSNASPFPGQTGNSGTTLGAQRLNVFKAAANYWGERLKSPVPIRVRINFDPLFCEPGRAVLGSAGPFEVFKNFSNAPLANTWYVTAVVNGLVGSDVSPGVEDLGARFNSDIDNNNNCLTGTNWWLGINSPAPFGTISLYDTVLHEIGHGLGVLSLVGIQGPGVRLDGLNDAYSYHLFDEETKKYWRNMTNAQRVASSTNTGQLTWRGPNVDQNSGHLSAGSRTNGHVRMYAPNPAEPGSSVSHFDTALTPDELMEPFATATSDDRSTIQLLKDVGWMIEEVERAGTSFLASVISLLFGEEP